MSNGFLKRWSKKKRTEEPTPDAVPAEPPPSNPSQSSGQALPLQAGERLPSPPPRSGGGREGAAPPTNPPSEQAKPPSEVEEPEIDPATLPPIESLGADSDYTVFLKKGVPEALRIAALRKAWAADPFIREFRSPAIEYGWDFTGPEYNLRATDDVAKLLDQIFPPKPSADAAESAGAEAAGAKADAKPEIEPPPEAEAPPPRSIAAREPDPGPPLSQPRPEPIGRDNEPERPPAVPRRKHGGALPD